MYTRASAVDYDDWETIHGNPGWGSKDLIPLLQKVNYFILFAFDLFLHNHRPRITRSNRIDLLTDIPVPSRYLTEVLSRTSVNSSSTWLLNMTRIVAIRTIQTICTRAMNMAYANLSLRDPVNIDINILGIYSAVAKVRYIFRIDF